MWNFLAWIVSYKKKFKHSISFWNDSSCYVNIQYAELEFSFVSEFLKLNKSTWLQRNKPIIPHETFDLHLFIVLVTNTLYIKIFMQKR